MNEDKIKVLYIAGNGRSGSTILHNILGQLDGFVAVGELRYIWERGIIKNKLCGCGSPFHDCDRWQTILGAAYGRPDNVDAAQMSRDTESFRLQDLPRTFIPALRQKEIDRLQDYLSNLGRLYKAVGMSSGSRVIVDSSKNPSYGYLLQFIPAVELYVLHFTRDSQAVAYSWSKRKEFQPGDYMARKTPVVSSFQWNSRNLATDMFLQAHPERFLRLRYEDFIAHPHEAVTAVTTLLGEANVPLPFSASHTVELKRANHSVFGNPVRFQQGPVTLRLDNKWRSNMTKRDKLTVAALTWPLRLKYGYLRQDDTEKKVQQMVPERPLSNPRGDR